MEAARADEDAAARLAAGVASSPKSFASDSAMLGHRHHSGTLGNKVPTHHLHSWLPICERPILCISRHIISASSHTFRPDRCLSFISIEAGLSNIVAVVLITKVVCSWYQLCQTWPHIMNGMVSMNGMDYMNGMDCIPRLEWCVAGGQQHDATVQHAPQF